jgi:protein-disulfide isomerase
MNMKSVVVFIAVTLGILLGVGGLLWQFGNTENKAIPEIAGERKHVKGSGEITLVEFSDFQCPACLSVQAPLKEILKKYEGKVQFVYRHFPLTNIHKNAMMAAQASEAAEMQGKFWEFHDLLFSKQGEWSGLGDPREKFGEYAQQLELDIDKFVSDMESQAAKDIVSTDILASTRYRLTGTPTFYINGVETEFAQIQAKLESLTQ